MKNKKAMEVGEIIKIFIGVAILAIIFIGIFPHIRDLPGKGLEALGVLNNKCEYSGLTAEDYSEKISRALYNGQMDIAILYFDEFREKCDFEISDLMIGGGQGREKSLEFAEELCKRGNFMYSKEAYEKLYDEDNPLDMGPFYEKCLKFAELSNSLALSDYEEAEEIADTITISQEDPPTWNILMGDAYLQMKQYQSAYNVYINNYNEDPNVFEISSQVKILGRLKEVYNSVLAEKFISAGSTFRFSVPEKYLYGITSFEVSKRTLELSGEELDISGLEDVSQEESYKCNKEEDSWECESIDSCNMDLMELI